jgi:proteasome beta subunit
MNAQQAVRVCVQALYDAADDDSATGGPDLTRQIFPIIAVLDADGFSQLTDTEAGDQVRAVVEERMESPDGPKAPVE